MIFHLGGYAMIRTKLFFVTFALVFISWSLPSNAQQSVYKDSGNTTNIQKTGDVGVGLLIGVPTALGVKYWTAEDRAVNFNLAFSSGDVAIIGDYLWHFRNAVADMSSGRMPNTLVPYIGAGGLIIFNNATDQGIFGDSNNNGSRPLYRRADTTGTSLGFGARLPIGLEFLPNTVPLGIFAEIAPGAVIVPDGIAFFQVGLGARYYF
jgi:hypothetical protein